MPELVSMSAVDLKDVLEKAVAALEKNLAGVTPAMLDAMDGMASNMAALGVDVSGIKAALDVERELITTDLSAKLIRTAKQVLNHNLELALIARLLN